MKVTLTALAIALATGLPALADDAHHPDQQGTPPTADTGASAKSVAPAVAPTVKKMQDNTRKMQGQLERIAKTKNETERKKLVAEHMQTMHENLRLARGLEGPGMDCPMMGAGMGMMGGASEAAGSGGEMMMGRMQQMEKRMDMMQMMMEQMAKPTAPK